MRLVFDAHIKSEINHFFWLMESVKSIRAKVNFVDQLRIFDVLIANTGWNWERRRNDVTYINIATPMRQEIYNVWFHHAKSQCRLVFDAHIKSEINHFFWLMESVKSITLWFGMVKSNIINFLPHWSCYINVSDVIPYTLIASIVSANALKKRETKHTIFVYFKQFK
jgi:hypothetical protein